MKITTPLLAALAACALSGAPAAADDPAWGANPAGYLGAEANFVNGVQFVGWSPQDHPNGGQGSPKYDIYNYLVLNHVDPNSRTWATDNVAGLNKMHPCEYWADDGQTIMYEDEYVHSDVPGHGDPGGAIPGATGQFTWGGTNGYVKPGNPCGGPSGQVNPPAGGAAASPGGSASSESPAGGSASISLNAPVSAGCPPGGKATMTSRTAPADEINLANVTVENSPGDVASWSPTTQLTLLDFQGSGPLANFTKETGAGSWPDVLDPSRWANGGSIQFTLWMIVKVNGQWYGSGGIEFWRGSERNGGAPSGFGHNWFYDKGRWGPMANYQPAVGEKVGFMVTAGDARNNGLFLVKERSNVVLVPFPSDCGGTFVFTPAAASAP